MSLHASLRAVALGLLSAGLASPGWAQMPTAPTAPIAHTAPTAPTAPAAGEGRTYSSRPFERVELAGSANVRLFQGDRDQVFVLGDAEAQKAIELDFSGDRLQIRSVDGWKMWRSQKPMVDVTLRKLTQLSLSGAGDLYAPGPMRTENLQISISGAGAARFDDLVCDRLAFGISGAGEGRFSGQVNEMVLRISGKGKLQAENLQAAKASISISGIGGAEVWATDVLKLSVSGFGQIDYWGHPEVSRNQSGIAKINARGDKAITTRGAPNAQP